MKRAPVLVRARDSEDEVGEEAPVGQAVDPRRLVLVPSLFANVASGNSHGARPVF